MLGTRTVKLTFLWKECSVVDILESHKQNQKEHEVNGTQMCRTPSGVQWAVLGKGLCSSLCEQGEPWGWSQGLLHGRQASRSWAPQLPILSSLCFHFPWTSTRLWLGLVVQAATQLYLPLRIFLFCRMPNNLIIQWEVIWPAVSMPRNDFSSGW